MSLSVLVVVYNQTVDEILCLEPALSAPSVGQVVVCDNSTCDNDNAERAERLGITYLDMHGNAGLSKAYNAGVTKCTGDVICIFDDDTTVQQDYFDAVASLWNSSIAWDIALPLVMDGTEILSPCLFNGFRSRAFSSLTQIKDSLRMSGINSGMAIKRSLFSRVAYDESLFLDLVDHRFIEDARNAGASIAFLDGPVLHQEYSLRSDSYDAAINRFGIFEKDAKTFYSDTALRRLYCSLMLAQRRLKLVSRYGIVRQRKGESVSEGGTQ